MDGRSDSSKLPVLRPEVEPPQRPHAGLGVMLVASAAMFFAVASSAFVLRARAPERRCFHRSQPARAVTPAPQVEETPTTRCEEPVETVLPDGTRSVSFRLCEKK